MLTLLALLFVFPLISVAFVQVLGPSLPRKPFLVIWDDKTGKCTSHFNIPLPLQQYGIVHNQNQTWRGQYMINVNPGYGLYPYINQTSGEWINGGLPQLANISAHLDKMKQDIEAHIPDSLFRGIAMLDWEEWKPTYEHNLDSRKIYQTFSIELVQKEHPDWPEDKVHAAAKEAFEEAAKAFMLQTLELAKSLRPEGFWGFYEFPTCSNYQYKPESGYNCGNRTFARDDALAWLFNASDALFASMYFDVATSVNASLKVKYTDLEALRVDGERNVQAPVYLYQIFGNTVRGFLSRDMLAESLGQSAALGFAGVIYWGDSNQESSSSSCREISDYLTSTLGPYVAEVIGAAEACSQSLCSGHGRCYVPRSVSLEKGDKFMPTMDSQWTDYKMYYECQCFGFRQGEDCSRFN